VFNLADEDITFNTDDITDAWDFGTEPGKHCSYSYHMPYVGQSGASFPINVSSNPSCPVAADRSPYFDQNADSYLDDANPDEDGPPTWKDGEYYDPDKTCNAAAHQREGQNVLFNDSHVSFEKWPNCGVDNDNIWRFWGTNPPDDAEDKQLSDGGQPGEVGDDEPMAEEDALLVCERQDMY
ncbi:MAG: hypothetical protein DRP62_05370, partial [Planctomycetota bacterium]